MLSFVFTTYISLGKLLDFKFTQYSMGLRSSKLINESIIRLISFLSSNILKWSTGPIFQICLPTDICILIIR